MLECMSSIIHCLLLQAGQVSYILKLKLLQCMQFPQISRVFDALYDGTKESTRSIPDMSVFDYPTLDDNTLLVASQIFAWRQMDQDLQHCSGKVVICQTFQHQHGGYHQEALAASKPQLMAKADELFLGNQEPRSTWRGLYPLLTLAQHSCCPNSVICYVGETAMRRATQDLLADDHVTISHVALLSVPVRYRQQQLQDSPNFTWCPRCTVEGKLPRRIQTKIQAIKARLGLEARH
ncbi:TPA: hypothetical protein ACH3X1_003264 [Trebouxia sp. C0004]